MKKFFLFLTIPHIALCVYDFWAKRHKTYRRKFEKLFSERNSHNGYTPDASADKSGKGDFPTENDYPENIEKGASESEFFIAYFFFERERTYPGDFEALDSGRKSDNGYTEQKPRQSPFEPEQCSAEKEPQNIPQCFHYIDQPFFFAVFPQVFIFFGQSQFFSSLL